MYFCILLKVSQPFPVLHELARRHIPLLKEGQLTHSQVQLNSGRYRKLSDIMTEDGYGVPAVVLPSASAFPKIFTQAGS